LAHAKVVLLTHLYIVSCNPRRIGIGDVLESALSSKPYTVDGITYYPIVDKYGNPIASENMKVIDAVSRRLTRKGLNIHSTNMALLSREEGRQLGVNDDFGGITPHRVFITEHVKGGDWSSGIDPKIRKSCVQLTRAGATTFGSCGGHEDRTNPHPYIMLKNSTSTARARGIISRYNQTVPKNMQWEVMKGTGFMHPAGMKFDNPNVAPEYTGNRSLNEMQKSSARFARYVQRYEPSQETRERIREPNEVSQSRYSRFVNASQNRNPWAERKRMDTTFNDMNKVENEESRYQRQLRLRQINQSGEVGQNRFEHFMRQADYWNKDRERADLQDSNDAYIRRNESINEPAEYGQSRFENFMEQVKRNRK